MRAVLTRINSLRCLKRIVKCVFLVGYIKQKLDSLTLKFFGEFGVDNELTFHWLPVYWFLFKERAFDLC